MLGVIKKLCSLLIWIFMSIFQLFRRKPEKAPLDTTKETPRGGQDTWDESGWGGEGWEDFTVRVVPNSSEEEPSSPQEPDEQPEEDFFKDMAPVFKRAKKIAVQQQAKDDRVNMNKFAVQNSFQNEEHFVGELGVWNEEDSGAAAWEEDLPDEGELVQTSRESMREKRRLEREKRKAAQEALRKQQRTAGQHFQLGTKVS